MAENIYFGSQENVTSVRLSSTHLQQKQLQK